MHLDKYLIKHAALSRKKVLLALHNQQVLVNGNIVNSRNFEVSKFDEICFAGKTLSNQQKSFYLMMNKPAGILSATVDESHTTAIELINEPFKTGLHIAGRLDRASTGLLILTNDGKWSRQLTEPKEKIPKQYWVKTIYSISPDTMELFAKGIYFKYENITTSPAELEMINENECLLTIYEGRYHQIKRMFAAAGNRVKDLHRISMGGIILDKNLKPGEYRALTEKEILSIKSSIV